MNAADPFASWRLALAGGKPGMHLDEPWCGYFKLRDRRGLMASQTPIKRPWIACAIWPGDGNLVAEMAGSVVHVEKLWPYVAKTPIPYETYQYWHAHERWPDEEQVA